MRDLVREDPRDRGGRGDRPQRRRFLAQLTGSACSRRSRRIVGRYAPRAAQALSEERRASERSRLESCVRCGTQLGRARSTFDPRALDRKRGLPYAAAREDSDESARS